MNEVQESSAAKSKPSILIHVCLSGRYHNTNLYNSNEDVQSELTKWRNDNTFRILLDYSCIIITRHKKKWRGILLYHPNHLSVCPSARPSVRPSALRFRTLSHKKVAGYTVIRSEPFVCVSVRPSAFRFRTLTWVVFGRFSSNFA